MPQIAGATVWLEIDGVRLEEFGVERNEETKTVTCWVPCELGKDFRFVVSLDEPAPRSHHYRIRFEPDGKQIPSSNLQRRTIKKDSKCTPERPVYYEGQQEEKGLRPFRFASVRLTDDDSHMSDVSKLGDLIVRIHTFQDYRVEKVKRGKKAIPKAVTPTSLGETVVHERAKKGLTNCVQFGELRPLSAGSSSKSKVRMNIASNSFPIDVQQVGKIIFKYRKMDILIADGIAPRRNANTARTVNRGASSSSASKTATPNLNNGDVEVIKVEANGDDDEAKLQRLKARAAALKELCELNTEIEALESKKRARGGGGSTNPPKKVKKEPKIAHFAPGEIIDLT